MADLVVEKLVKTFDGAVAVDRIGFTLRDGEFLTLLGPSGCGKSTTLSAVAGLDRSDDGIIRLGGRTLFSRAEGIFVPPEGRNCGMVFQSYALWPHLTVAENLAFPLKLRRVGGTERARRIGEVLDLVELGPLAGRYPGQLSGGQQQRVALARALVYRPEILLLDEPLSNLDAQLRERARSWLGELRGRLGLTTLYVTHDQAEALALSDRIAVMRKGRIVQLADPRTIYDAPGDPFVAAFIGASNVIDGEVMAADDRGGVEVALRGGARLHGRARVAVMPGDPVSVAVRPEHIRLSDPLAGGLCAGNGTPVGDVMRSTYLGDRHQYEIDLRGSVLRAYGDRPCASGRVRLEVPPEQCLVFPRETESTAPRN